MDGGERGILSRRGDFINPKKKYCLSRESKQRPPVLKALYATDWGRWVRLVYNMMNSIPLSNDKILDLSKLKAFSDDILYEAQTMKFVSGGILSGKHLEHLVGKGENAGYQHFLLFPLCFQKKHL